MRHRFPVRPAAGCLLVLAAFAACTGDVEDPEDGDEGRESSPAAVVQRLTTEVDAGDEGTFVEGALVEKISTYVATSRVDLRDGDEILTSYERSEVVRPWQSRLTRGPVVGAIDDVVEVGTFGRRRIGSQEGLVLALPPALAPADVRLAVLSDAERLGVAERREHREIDDRRCQVIRTETGLAAASLPVLAKNPDEYVDTCVSADGLMVEEATFDGGALIRLRTLVDVVEEPLVAIAIEGAPATVKDGGGSIARLTPESALPEGMWSPPGDPEGFVRRGRYAVVPPQPENFTDPAREGYRTAGVADVWERGIDALVLDQGGSLRGLDPLPPLPDGARTVDLGEVGTAEVFVSFRMSELRIRRPGGRYVIVYGTLALAELEAFARSLTFGPGGSLTPLPNESL